MKLLHAITKAQKELYNCGFKESTVERSYGYIWRRMLKNSTEDTEISVDTISKHLIEYYSKDFLKIDNNFLNKNERIIKRVFNDLLQFVETSKFNYKPMCAYDHSLTEFSNNILDKYLQYQKLLSFKDRTIYNKKEIITRFLHLYSLETLKDIDVLNFIKSLSNRNKYAARLDMNIIKNFLIFAYEKKHISTQFKDLFPVHKVSSNNNLPSYYTPEELKTLLKHTKSCNNETSKRDYAIICLLISTGLRAKDVCELSKSNINWESNTISIVTSKTNKQIILPLLTNLGNAIIDYLLNERPVSSLKNIFLKKDGTKLNSQNITTIVNKEFIDSSIIINNRKCGAHSLRSSLASRMLNNNIPILTISKSLIHDSIETTKSYLKIDIDNLRKCELEVPNDEI